MIDLNNIKDKWKVYYEEKINSSVDSLWDLISSPSNLEIFHPFCKSNKIVKWPGEHSIDELIYLNGLTFIRKFKSWDKKKGYSLLIGEKEKEQSYVVWEISSKNYKNYLSITVYPHFMRKYPKIISYIPHKIMVEPYLKKYLKSVIGGIDYYLKNRETVPRNYFGQHEWFSEK